MPIIHLFIDTNIFLEFYKFSKDDLDQLHKLLEKIEKKEINLHLTRHLKEEIERNREAKISEAHKLLNDAISTLNKLNGSLPTICKDFDEFTEAKESLETASRKINSLSEKIISEMKEHKLKVDVLINELMQKVKIIESEKYIHDAKIRVDLGTPPGKAKSLGDAINWLALLDNENIPEKEDLFFITKDSDFISKITSSEFNSFLLKEWKEKKSSNIKCFQMISTFSNEIDPYLKLKIQEEKKELIDSFANSYSFANARENLRRLYKIEDFNEIEINDIARAIVNNNQINWIVNDSDIKLMIKKMILENDQVEDAYKEKIKEFIAKN